MKYKNLTLTEGGVCAAKGFKANGIHCGLRKNKTKEDLAIVSCDKVCNAAAVYTQNLVKGAPLLVTKKNLKNGEAQAIICNSGNANTCNADGEEKAQRMCEIAAENLGIEPEDVVVASTGVIGEIMPIEPIEKGCPALVEGLSETGNEIAAQAIMTTDTHKKEFAVKFMLGDKECTMGGMAKGSGMIHPNMATMLCFMTTDVLIDKKLLQFALSSVTKDTFNMVSVDGDTSTNDMAVILASGEAENEIIDDIDSPEYQIFIDALFLLMMNLSREIARDGEGATKLLECAVSGACDEKNAKIVAKSVITSSLFKSAMFGADANWGRILCAVGYSGAELDINGVSVFLSSEKGSIKVCENGAGVKFSEEKAKEILLEDEIKISIFLQDGSAGAVAWGCDLTYDYVKINGDYRT